MFKQIYLHWKYNRILKKVYKDENILDNMGKLLNTKVHIDWVGRLYTVINPNLLDVSEQVFEATDNGYDNTQFIEKWLMERLIAMQKFIQASNLFDLLTFDIRKIDNYGNYLVILEPITWKDCASSLKKLGYSLLTILAAIIIYSSLHNLLTK